MVYCVERILKATKNDQESECRPLMKEFEEMVALYRSGKATQEELLVAVFEMYGEHPWVKHSTHPMHALGKNFFVTITSATIDFKAWLKSTGTDTKPPPSDDMPYAGSELLRAGFPRGFSRIEIRKGDNVIGRTIHMGLPKFGGLNLDDDDDNHMAPDDIPESATNFVVSVKANGENGKLGFLRLDGQLFAVASSKNVPIVWLIKEDGTWGGSEEEFDAFLACRKKAAAAGGGTVDSIVLHLLTHVLKDPSDMVDKVYPSTLMFEFENMEDQHIIRLPETCIKVFAILQNDGDMMSQENLLKTWDSLKWRADVGAMRHVNTTDPLSCKEKLSATVHAVRGDSSKEGAVLYFYDNDENCVAMKKVKSSWYVIARALRQIFQRMVSDPLSKGSVCFNRTNFNKRIACRFVRLTHVPGCDKLHTEWANSAMEVYDKWVEKYLENETPDEKKLRERSGRKAKGESKEATLCEQMLYQVKHQYPHFLMEFGWSG